MTTPDEALLTHTTDPIKDSVLSESKRYVIRMFLISVCQIFMSASRHPIWILYAQSNQFDHPIHPSYHLISWVLYAGMFWKGIGSLFYVSIANKIGYDKGVIILLTLNVASVFMEAITHNFIVLSIGFFLSHTGITNVVLSAIAWLLPHATAVKYTSLLNASTIIGFILGPAITGIVSKHLSYQWVFWINGILGSVVLLYAIVFIGINSQKSLELKQLNIKYDKDTPGEYKYPNYLKMKNERLSSRSQYKMSRCEWFMLIASIGSNSLGHVSTVVMGFYYVLFVTQNLKHSNVLKASIQLLLMSLGAIIGTLLAVKCFKKRFVFLRYVIMLLMSAGYGCMTYFVYQHYTNINMWYLYTFGSGFMVGLFVMLSQIIMLEYLPPSKAGYMYGCTALVRSLLKALSLLFVGLYWTKRKYIMFDVMTISMCGGFGLTLLMALCHWLMRLFPQSNAHRNRFQTKSMFTEQSTMISSIHSIN